MSLTRVKNITSNLTVDGTLTTTSTGTSLTSNSYNVVKIQTDKDDNGSVSYTHLTLPTILLV